MYHKSDPYKVFQIFLITFLSLIISWEQYKYNNSVKLQDSKSIYKNLAFLYTNNEPSEREIKKISLKIASKRIKYLRINLTKEVKNPYSENLDGRS